MFQQGLSGLDGASQSLDVIGNNIANASTVGFKSSTAEFADVYANSLNSVSGNTAGIGVSVGTIAQNFTQGSIQASANPLDVSINGGGFFRTVAPNGAIEFSRNGQFTVSSPNYVLTNAQGAQLTGYLANSTGQIQQSSPVPLAINQSDIPPVATTTLALQENLNSAKSTPTVSPFNPSDSNSYTFAGSATQVYDSLGNAHQMQEYYVKTASNSWDVYTTVDGNELAAQTALQTMSTDTATLAARAQYQTDLTTTPAVDPTVIQGDLAAYAAAAGAALSAAAVAANASQDQQDKLTAVYDPTTGVGTQVGTTPDKIDAALAAAQGRHLGVRPERRLEWSGQQPGDVDHAYRAAGDDPADLAAVDRGADLPQQRLGRTADDHHLVHRQYAIRQRCLWRAGRQRHRRAEPERLRIGLADRLLDRRRRHHPGQLHQLPVASAGPDRHGQLRRRQRPDTAGQQRLVGQCQVGPALAGRAQLGQHGGAQGQLDGTVERRPDDRAGQHDHRAARLPGQCADHQDRGLDPANGRQPAVSVSAPPPASGPAARDRQARTTRSKRSYGPPHLHRPDRRQARHGPAGDGVEQPRQRVDDGLPGPARFLPRRAGGVRQRLADPHLRRQRDRRLGF